MGAIWLFLKGLSPAAWLRIAEIFAIITVVGFIWGKYEFMAYKYHHSEAKIAELTTSLQDEKDIHKKDIESWTSQKQQLETTLASMKHEKEAAVKHEFEMFQDTNKKQQINQKKAENEIKVIAKAVDVVTVPHWFTRLYNNAIDRTRVASEGSGDPAVKSADSSGVEGATDTFEAAPFAQVVIGNVDQYSTLALQCNSLINAVNAVEAVNAKAKVAAPR